MSLCTRCKVQDFAPCPRLEELYEEGVEDSNITECKWKHFFDNYHEAKTEAKKVEKLSSCSKPNKAY